MNAQKLLLAKFKDSLIRFTKKEISHLAVRVADVVESKKQIEKEAMIAEAVAKVEEASKKEVEALELQKAWVDADLMVATEKAEALAKAKASASWFSRG